MPGEQLHGLTRAAVDKIKRLIREAQPPKSSKPGTRRTRREGSPKITSAGSNRSAGTESGLALCVTDLPGVEGMPGGSIPDLSGVSMADWEYEPGQDGVAADRASMFGEAGVEFERYLGEAGVVLVDWKRNWDHADMSTYEDAIYDPDFKKLAPMVEAFSEDKTYIGGGLGGTGGGGTGAGGGGGGGGI